MEDAGESVGGCGAEVGFHPAEEVAESALTGFKRKFVWQGSPATASGKKNLRVAKVFLSRAAPRI